MQAIYTAQTEECPLGISDCCPKCSDVSPAWKSCVNARYCERVCESWLLPLVHPADGFQKVWLHRRCPRIGFGTETAYKNYIRRYGWAEAIQLPYRRYLQVLDQVRDCNIFEVHQNNITAGFAEAVPLINVKRFPNLHKFKSGYSQDSQGYWWYGDRRALRQVLRLGIKKD